MFRVLLMALLACTFASTAAAQTPRKPNVIIIYADDMGYGDLGCFGNKKIKTPNLDKMASEGVRLTSFYVAQAVCSASRAALMTGKYSNRAGVLGGPGPNAKNGLARKHTTIAEMLKTLGYATAIVGKWHLGHLPEYLADRVASMNITVSLIPTTCGPNIPPPSSPTCP